jgi:transposase
MQQATGSARERTVGLDIGDRTSRYILSQDGTLLEEGQVATTETALRRRFSPINRARVALEVGTHSPWVGRLVADCGHEVIVANPRQLRLIYESHRKSDLALLRSRDGLVRARADLVNDVRGAVKSVGCRIPKCSTLAFARRAEAHVPELLEATLQPVLETITQLSEQIHELDRWPSHGRGGPEGTSPQMRAAAQGAVTRHLP